MTAPRRPRRPLWPFENCWMRMLQRIETDFEQYRCRLHIHGREARYLSYKRRRKGAR
jgi:hypothetical protein